MATGIIKYESPLMVPQEQATEMKKRILYSMAGIRDEYGALADNVAGALAQMALAFELNPFLGEIWALPVKKHGKTAGYSLFVGYKGYQRAAHKVCAQKGTDYTFIASKLRRLTSQEV